ncbi:MAG: hypothetical protein JXK94_02700 [Deltaproteobacteria bacterium]|nr:hypothetical protein [Deltaproteobacteria bacterium]
MFLSDQKKMEMEKHYEEVLKDVSREELVNRIINVNRCLQSSWPNASSVVDACIIELNQYVKRLAS